ncbi:MAG: glutamate racemase [Firmicutes bacterium]|nr:glutamate racemase [Bacillota bacterium]
MAIIGVIDSGVGGVSTLSAVSSLLPSENYIYVADRSHCPYGGRSDSFIIERVGGICEMLVGIGADAVALACNTATNVCIDILRERFSRTLIVGVEPAIKPAVEELTFGKALVLLTPAAAVQSKFLSLLEAFDRDRIIVSPQPSLAALIENNIGDLKKIGGEVERLLSPLITPEIESVVLGCTHYCLIRDKIADIFAAKIYDGNVGAAIRLYSLLKQKKLISRGGRGEGVRFVRL